MNDLVKVLEKKPIEIAKIAVLTYLAFDAVKKRPAKPVMIVNNFYYSERKTNG